MNGKARSTPSGIDQEVGATPLINSKNHGPASLPTPGDENATRLLGILCELRAVDILFDPIPASRKHDEIYKRHDEFLCAMQAMYEPSWKTP